MEKLIMKVHRQKGDANGTVGNLALERAEAVLPEKFIAWQMRSRLELYEKLLRREPVLFLASHLPVLATLRPQGTVNLATKGVGLMPKHEHIVHYVELFARVLRESGDLPRPEMLAARIEAARAFLRHPDHIDARRLGSLEIFEGETFRNIRGDPRVALLYTGTGPGYLSFQVEAIARIAGPGEPAYEFLRASRLLFERESFHIAQPAYPHAYQFLVSEVREKTPHPRGS